MHLDTSPSPASGAGSPPEPPSSLLEAGVAHHAAGRLGAAAACYARAVDLAPELGAAWRLLGILAIQSGDPAAARGLLSTALHFDGGDAATHAALAGLEEQAGAYAAAHIAYRTALALDPGFDAAAAGAIRVLLRLERPRDAAPIAHAAIQRGTNDAALLRAIGAAFLAVREYHAAIDACRAAIAVAPHADAFANLAAAYARLHRSAEAVAACEAALAQDAGHADAANTLGIALKAQGDDAAALRAFERAIGLGSEAAHVNLGTTRLLLGDYRGGWPEYGWTTPERRANPVAAALPLWDGAPLAGKQLLIWPEQGIGDTFQLVRFASGARERGAVVTLACPPATREILSTVAGVDAFVDEGELRGAELRAFDLWLPTIRLPVVLGVTPLDLRSTAYLRADPVRAGAFEPILAAAAADRLRVGLVWSGNPEFVWNEARSCGLAALASLREVAGVTFFALQQGAARALGAASPLPLVPINVQVRDFADTAAIVAGLDLVITVDTSVAHLVGALGRPGWVLLSSAPDWRWTAAGQSTPWYPSLRLFRQTAGGGWPPVIAQLALALRERVAQRTCRSPRA